MGALPGSIAWLKGSFHLSSSLLCIFALSSVKTNGIVFYTSLIYWKSTVIYVNGENFTLQMTVSSASLQTPENEVTRCNNIHLSACFHYLLFYQQLLINL
jgi:hypothetical protein